MKANADKEGLVLVQGLLEVFHRLCRYLPVCERVFKLGLVYFTPQSSRRILGDDCPGRIVLATAAHGRAVHVLDTLFKHGPPICGTVTATGPMEEIPALWGVETWRQARVEQLTNTDGPVSLISKVLRHGHPFIANALLPEMIRERVRLRRVRPAPRHERVARRSAEAVLHTAPPKTSTRISSTDNINVQSNMMPQTPHPTRQIARRDG